MFEEEVRRAIAKKPNLKSKAQAWKWLEWIMHAVHLQILSQEKLDTLLRIARVALLKPKQNWRNAYCNFHFSEAISADVFLLTIDKENAYLKRKKIHHAPCLFCLKCACGCGMTAKQLWDQEEKLQMQNRAETIVEAHEWPLPMAEAFRQHFMKCKFGRWKKEQCNHHPSVIFTEAGLYEMYETHLTHQYIERNKTDKRKTQKYDYYKGKENAQIFSGLVACHLPHNTSSARPLPGLNNGEFKQAQFPEHLLRRSHDAHAQLRGRNGAI